MKAQSQQARKSLDGVFPPRRKHWGRHLAIKKFFDDLPSRGAVYSTHAALVVYDPVDPCKSYILVEHFAAPGMPAKTTKMTIARVLDIIGWYVTHFDTIAAYLNRQPKKPLGGKNA